MKFTDTHCHLTNEFFDNVGEIIENAENNNVLRYISDATNIESCHEMIELSNRFDNVYITLGIHPESCEENFEELENIIRNNVNNSKFIAIGEIGLDYYYGKETKDKQIELLNKELKLAEELDLPVVIHSREATLDTIETLKRYKVKGVIHCFSGSLETAKILLDMGYYIGVGGVMTFKNSKIDEVIKEIPLDRLLLETDSPFLTPEPFRKYSNEPKYIYTIAEYLAKLKGVSLEEVSRQTEENIRNLFNI